jgi:para-nitrobenzyl esterase
VFFVPDMWTPIDSDDELERRFRASGMVPPLGDDQYRQLIDMYRAAMPASSTRTELLVAMVTDIGMWHSALRQAETKLADRSAPVFSYEFAWRTPSFGGSWAPHAGELPFVFGNLTYGTAWDGTDTDAMRTADDPQGLRFTLAEQMMRAWAAFAHHADPSTADLPWPAYDLQNRSTMVFDRGASTVVPDRNSARRRIVEQLPTAW